MNDVTLSVDPSVSFPFPTPPASGTMEEVAPGVYWVRMPMPLALDHINLWLIADGNDWTLVDSGWAGEETITLWQRILAGPAANRTLGRLICTHYHPDHFGLSGWLARTFGVPVLMTDNEWVTGALLQRIGDDAFTEGQDAFFAQHGLSPDIRAWFRTIGNNYRKRVLPPPDRFTRLRDGETIVLGDHLWRVMTAGGHAAEQACLYGADLGVLISGDQILPEITPNISVHWFKSGSRPLADNLESLKRFEDLPADTLVLPSHKRPFRGLHGRLAELRQHHAARLSALEAFLADGAARSAAATLPALFSRKLLEAGKGKDHHHLMFAIGEAVAHLDHLVDEGRVTERTADDGTTTYQGKLVSCRSQAKA